MNNILMALLSKLNERQNGPYDGEYTHNHECVLKGLWFEDDKNEDEHGYDKKLLHWLLGD